MGKWSTILGIGKKVANHSATQTTARSIGGALVHPQRTLAGLGNATKTAVMGGGMGYLAWEKLVNDKPVVRAAADLLVGEEAVDKGLEMAGNATNKIADAADKAGKPARGKPIGVIDGCVLGWCGYFSAEHDRRQRHGYVGELLRQSR